MRLSDPVTSSSSDRDTEHKPLYKHKGLVASRASDATKGLQCPSLDDTSPSVSCSSSDHATDPKLLHKRTGTVVSRASDASKGLQCTSQDDTSPSVSSSSSNYVTDHKLLHKRKRERRYKPISKLLQEISPTASPDRKRTRGKSWLPRYPPDSTNRRLRFKRKGAPKSRTRLQLRSVASHIANKPALKPAHDPFASTATVCLPSGTPIFSLNRSPDPAFSDNNFVT